MKSRFPTLTFPTMRARTPIAATSMQNAAKTRKGLAFIGCLYSCRQVRARQLVAEDGLRRK
jgi:hypothetical protein